MSVLRQTCCLPQQLFSVKLIPSLTIDVIFPAFFCDLLAERWLMLPNTMVGQLTYTENFFLIL